MIGAPKLIRVQYDRAAFHDGVRVVVAHEVLVRQVHLAPNSGHGGRQHGGRRDGMDVHLHANFGALVHRRLQDRNLFGRRTRNRRHANLARVLDAFHSHIADSLTRIVRSAAQIDLVPTPARVGR